MQGNPMRRLLLLLALTAPYAAALGCDAGGCCDMQMAEHGAQCGGRVFGIAASESLSAARS